MLSAAPLPFLLLACAGASDTGTRPTTTTEDDTGASTSGCPLYAGPSLAECAVHVLDDYDPKRLEPDLLHSWYDANADVSATWLEAGEDPEDRTLTCLYTWERAGEPLDARCSGSSTYTYEWLYEGGLAVAKTYDQGSDGVLDRSWSYSHDADQNLILETWDSDLDGAPDGSVAYTWAEGLLQQEDWDYEEDGAIDLRIHWTWQGPGLPTRMEKDRSADGTIDAISTWGWDAAGNPLWEEIDSDADGVASDRTAWTYEECRPVGIDIESAQAPSMRGEYHYDPDTEYLAEILWFYDDDEKEDATETWTTACPADVELPEL